jgi:hypothetical protein
MRAKNPWTTTIWFSLFSGFFLVHKNLSFPFTTTSRVEYSLQFPFR